MEADVALGPPKELHFKRRLRPIAFVKELWHFRELARTLAERELRARYKQAFLGIAWSLLVPVILMIVFTVFLQRVADVNTRGVPYPLFSYIGLLPWTFFSSSLSQGGQSLISNIALLNKIYCPREVFPIGSIVVAAVDTIIATIVLLVLFVITGYAPRITSLYVPVLVIIQLIFVLGATLVASTLLVYLRDLRHILPLVLQLGLFATPVAYPIDPSGALDGIYAALNPLAPIIEGYRRSVLFGQPPEWPLVTVAAAVSIVMLVGGYLLFKKLEPGISDVA